MLGYSDDAADLGSMLSTGAELQNVEEAGAPAKSGSMLGDVFGLCADDVARSRALFAKSMASSSIDAGAVFDSFASGRPLVEALGLPEKTCSFLYARAYRWLSLGNTDRAEPLFHLLCLIDGQEVDYWIGYGICLRQRGVFGASLYCFSVAVSRRPNWAIPHFHTAALFMQQANWEKARCAMSRFEESTDLDEVSEAMRLEVVRWSKALEVRAGFEEEQTP